MMESCLYAHLKGFSTDMKKSNFIALATLAVAFSVFTILSLITCDNVLQGYKHLPKWGISIVGIVFLLMLFIPNIIWAKNQPEGYEEAAKRESKKLLAFERTGEVLACMFVVSDRRLDNFSTSPRLGYALVALVLMMIYELYWIKYFRSSRTLANMYSDFCGFPLAGATLPVFTLFLLGIYSQNIILITTAVILGIGHIGIHLMHKKEL